MKGYGWCKVPDLLKIVITEKITQRSLHFSRSLDSLSWNIRSLSRLVDILPLKGGINE